jgi:hypothetical protein
MKDSTHFSDPAKEVNQSWTIAVFNNIFYLKIRKLK